MEEAQCCINCGAVLRHEEMAIYMKLVNRGAKEYLCIPCLAKYFKCSEDIIYDRIKSLKQSGCTLFAADETR